MGNKKSAKPQHQLDLTIGVIGAGSFDKLRKVKKNAKKRQKMRKSVKKHEKQVKSKKGKVKTVESRYFDKLSTGKSG